LTELKICDTIKSDESQTAVKDDIVMESQETPVLSPLENSTQEQDRLDEASSRMGRTTTAAPAQRELDIQEAPGPQAKGKKIHKSDSPAIEESTEARLERLGRQRPDVFDSIWPEMGFVFSISMSQVLSVCSNLPHFSNLLY